MSDNHHNHNIDDKSGSEMLSEIMRLLLKLLLKILAKILILIVKGIKLLYAMLKMLLQACADFWYDNSTQEKLRMARIWCIHAMETTLQWCLIALRTAARWSIISLKELCKAVVWLAKSVVRGIIHLRPTLVAMRRAVAKGLRLLWQFTKSTARRTKAATVKQQRRYRQFRKNKGFKGLLIDIKNHLQMRLNDYMDEGQEDQTSDAMSYGEYIGDEIGEKGKTRSIGKKIYKSMNKLFDDNE